MKENLFCKSVIFIVVTVMFYILAIFIMHDGSEKGIEIGTGLIPLIMSVFLVGTYNLLTLDSKGKHEKLKKDHVQISKLIKYYGIRKNTHDESVDELCNIIDTNLKIVMSNVILVFSGIPIIIYMASTDNRAFVIISSIIVAILFVILIIKIWHYTKIFGLAIKIFFKY